MREIFGSALTKILPWVVPALIVASFLVNHKTPVGKSAEGAREKKQNGTGNTTSVTKAQSAPTQTQQLQSSSSSTSGTPILDAPLSDKDMTE